MFLDNLKNICRYFNKNSKNPSCTKIESHKVFIDNPSSLYAHNLFIEIVLSTLYSVQFKKIKTFTIKIASLVLDSLIVVCNKDILRANSLKVLFSFSSLFARNTIVVVNKDCKVFVLKFR